MGFLKKLGAAAGHVDKKLIETGLLARGDVVACERGSLVIGNNIKSLVCKVEVIVHLDGHEPYEAECSHPIELIYLPQFESGQGSVAVRVDPDDLTNIALDLAHEVPPVSGAGGVQAADPALRPETHAADPALGGTAGLLADGVACRAILLAVVPLDAKTSTGQDATGLVLSVTVVGRAPYQAQVGLFVPPEAHALLNLGADLPAKAMPDAADAVTIDWPAALAEAAGAPHETGIAPPAPPTATATPAARPATDLPGQLTQLADLHAAGALSDDEFALAKAELLAGGR